MPGFHTASCPFIQIFRLIHLRSLPLNCSSPTQSQRAHTAPFQHCTNYARRVKRQLSSPALIFSSLLPLQLANLTGINLLDLSTGGTSILSRTSSPDATLIRPGCRMRYKFRAVNLLHLRGIGFATLVAQQQEHSNRMDCNVLVATRVALDRREDFASRSFFMKQVSHRLLQRYLYDVSAASFSGEQDILYGRFRRRKHQIL